MGLLTKDATPDVAAMKTAAESLDIDLPDSEKPEDLIPVLRKAFKARLKGVPKDDWIVCPACGEFTDDAEELEACPFCGDDGLEDGEEPEEDEDAEPEPVDAADLDPVDEDAPEEPTAVDLDEDDAEEPLAAAEDAEDEAPAEEPTAIVPADNTEMVAALTREKALIKKAQTNMVRSGYDLGESLLRIHKGELWKAEGHKTFRKFLDTVSVSSTLAYDLMGLVEKFDKKTFLEVGRKRLLIVAKADGKDQKKLLDAAKKGATRRELADTARGGKPAAPPKEPKAPTPEKEDQITLLAKVGGRPKGYRFTDRKTKKALKVWEPDSYVEIQISPEVKQLVALQTGEDGAIKGISVAFVRVDQPAPKAEAKAANGKAANGAAKAKPKTTKKKTTKKATSKSASK